MRVTKLTHFNTAKKKEAWLLSIRIEGLEGHSEVVRVNIWPHSAQAILRRASFTIIPESDGTVTHYIFDQD